MYTDNWWWEKRKKLFIRAIIIPILLASNQTIISFSYKDQVFWPVYVTIDNFDI